MRELVVFTDEHVHPGTPVSVWRPFPDVEVWACGQYTDSLVESYGQPQEEAASYPTTPVRVTVHGRGAAVVPERQVTVAGVYHQDRCSCLPGHRVYRVTAEL